MITEKSNAMNDRICARRLVEGRAMAYTVSQTTCG
jgi:hypothetical protein